ERAPADVARVGDDPVERLLVLLPEVRDAAAKPDEVVHARPRDELGRNMLALAGGAERLDVFLRRLLRIAVVLVVERRADVCVDAAILEVRAIELLPRLLRALGRP